MQHCKICAATSDALQHDLNLQVNDITWHLPAKYASYF